VSDFFFFFFFFQAEDGIRDGRVTGVQTCALPIFLFNTLNTVSSLIRMDPDTARGVVLKLSNILRRLLRRHETFVPLREELQFIRSEERRVGKEGRYRRWP